MHIFQTMNKHRSVASCAGCHAKIDPPGFALESFDVIGGWREHYRTTGRGEAVVLDGRRMPYLKGPRVDPADVLADGRKQTASSDLLRALDVRIITGHEILSFAGDAAVLSCVWSHRELSVVCASALTITARLPHDALYQSLLAREGEWSAAGVRQVDCIGDALAPGLIAHAVYAGHRYAREFDDMRSRHDRADAVPFRRHMPQPPLA